MDAFIELVRLNPVRLVAAIQTTLAVAVLFGLPLTEAQLAGLVVALAAWLAFFTQKQVVAEHNLAERLQSLEP